MGHPDDGNPAKALADALTAARLEEEERYGIDVDDFTLTLGLTVKAKWQRAWAETRDCPAEPAGYEIEAVFCKGKDITFLFDDEDLERLQEELLD